MNLQKVTSEEIAEFNKNQDNIINRAVEKIFEIHNLDHFGEKSKDTMQSGMQFTIQTLSSIMSVAIPEMIEQQLAWGKDYLPTVGISTDMVLKNFELIREATAEFLSENKFPGIFTWLDFVISKQQEITK